MIGGLSNTSSRLALVAAAGLFMGGVAMPSAKAADLGGDCCADLEERVAELEATTARKGNRKMSLTITGQVNRMIMAWDDGKNRGVYYGIDNINSSSRFSFLGEATVSPWLKFGFEIMIEADGTSASTRVSQTSEDGSFSGTTYMAGNTVAQGINNSGNSDSFFGDARRIAAWVEHKEVGRLTVGRYESAGAMGTIDLGGVGAATGFGSVSLLQQNFALRTTAGGLSQATWSSFLDPSSYQSRQEVLRYDSPAIHGFIFSASVAEATGGFVGQTNYGAMVRYAGEHAGFRIAAGAGFEHYGDVYTNTAQIAGTGGITNANILIPGATAATNSPFTVKTPDINAWGVALSAMHVSSGLFLQGSVEGVSYNNAGSATSANWGETCGAATSGGTIVNTAPNSFNGVANTGGCNPKKDAWWWQLQGGIAKNWTGWGNTVLYAEYSKLYDWGAELGGRNYVSGVNTTANGFTTLQNVTSTTTTVWGLGLVQNFNNAATEWYLGYRNFALDLNSDATCVYGPTPNIATSHAAGTVVGCKISDFNLITTGLRVKF